jgi:hypothetical protein
VPLPPLPLAVNVCELPVQTVALDGLIEQVGGAWTVSINPGDVLVLKLLLPL